MKDPKNEPYIYLIAGVIAIGFALYFMTLEATNIFDWFILGMGIVAVYRGVRLYWDANGGLRRPRKPGAAAKDDAPPEHKPE